MEDMPWGLYPVPVDPQFQEGVLNEGLNDKMVLDQLLSHPKDTFAVLAVDVQQGRGVPIF